MPIYRVPAASSPGVVAVSGTVRDGTGESHLAGNSTPSQQQPAVVLQRKIEVGKSAGASVIDQETQRQHEREAQLKAERELLSSAATSSPSSSPSPASTAAAGLGSSDRRLADVINAAELLSRRRRFDGESSLVNEMDEHRQREEELRRERATSSAVNGHADVDAADGDVDDEKRGGAERRRIKVQPFGADDDDDESGASTRLSYITPRSDTLIEREIRLTRQREGSLRRVRGYPAVSQQTAVEVPLSGFAGRLQAPPATLTQLRATAPRQAEAGSGAVDDDVAMKRLATNRLRLEILRERKREVDLRSQGKIYTISEEHIERPPLLAELVAASGNSSVREIQLNNNEKSNSAASSKVTSGNTDEQRQSSTTAAPRRQQQQQQQQQPGRPQQHDEPERRRLVGEKLIEQEVRELRRREQELRDQRRQAGVDDVTLEVTTGGEATSRD